MQYRTFLETTAALTALPPTEAVDLVTPDENPATKVCDICDAEKSIGMIERTTVETTAPLEADICRAC